MIEESKADLQHAWPSIDFLSLGNLDNLDATIMPSCKDAGSAFGSTIGLSTICVIRTTAHNIGCESNSNVRTFSMNNG